MSTWCVNQSIWKKIILFFIFTKIVNIWNLRSNSHFVCVHVNRFFWRSRSQNWPNFSQEYGIRSKFIALVDRIDGTHCCMNNNISTLVQSFGHTKFGCFTRNQNYGFHTASTATWKIIFFYKFPHKNMNIELTIY